ncbi:MAG: APC family permease, partial [Anaerolineales bacterium]
MANDPVSSPERQGAVRFSRVLGLPWLVALGASVTVGLGVYTLLTLFVKNLGTGQVIGPYVLLGAIAVPIVLTLAERAAVVPGSGGLYRLARNSGTLWVGYFGGWLMLGGYAMLAALLGWGTALGVDLLLVELFGLAIDVRWIAVGVLGLVTIASLQGMRAAWRTKAAFVYASLVFLIVLSIRNLVAVSISEAVSDAVPRSFELFTITAFMASGLWGLDYILSVRDQVRRPTKTFLPALGLTVLAGVAFGVAAALALGPSLTTPSLTPLIDLAADSRLLPETIARILYSVFAIAITLIALNRALLNARNLLYAMSRDGLTTERIRSSSTTSGLHAWISLVFPTASVVLILIIPVELLVGLAAMTLMWAIAIVHVPDVIRARPNLPATKLPFHPLLPGLTTAIGVLLPFALGFLAILVGAAWLALGGLFYILYARARGLEVRREQIVVGEVSSERVAKPGYRVMADISRA